MTQNVLQDINTCYKNSKTCIMTN